MSNTWKDATEKDNNLMQLPRLKNLPKPLCKSLDALSNSKESENFSSQSKGDHQDLKPVLKSSSEGITNSSGHFDRLVKSLDQLQKRNSNVRMTVNLYYQPVINLQEEVAKRPFVAGSVLDKPGNEFNAESVYKPLLINASLFKSIETSDNLKEENVKIKPQFNHINKYDKKPTDNRRTETITKFNEISLRKRQKIDNNCTCESNTDMKSNYVDDPFFEQQITKIKYFWRGTNHSYPFAFKKRVLNYYMDTDEISMDEIVDYSKKVLVSDEMFF